jgi:hypothetical protein
VNFIRWFAIFGTTPFPEKQFRAFPKQLRILKLPNVSYDLNVLPDAQFRTAFEGSFVHWTQAAEDL